MTTQIRMPRTGSTPTLPPRLEKSALLLRQRSEHLSGERDAVPRETASVAGVHEHVLQPSTRGETHVLQ
jgi:hypothetical protein